MATLKQIRTAIAERLNTLDGVRAAEEWGDKINVSGNAVAAIVQKGPSTYDSVMSSEGDGTRVTIVCLAGRPSERAARDKLDALCDLDPDSATSVRNAVNGTLGGLVAWCTVESDSEYRDYDVFEHQYLGVEFVVAVGT